VIASNVPGAEEQLGDAALLVDPRDEEAMALAVKRLREDSQFRQSLIVKGRERAARWTGKHYVEKVLSILETYRPALRCWIPDLLSEKADGR
jgi:glycosyltransferase involved in cell wall biosynthesis